MKSLIYVKNEKLAKKLLEKACLNYVSMNK